MRETVFTRSGLLVVFPLSSCQGNLTLHIYNCIAEIENNYFNFAEGRKKQRTRERQRSLKRAECARSTDAR